MKAVLHDWDAEDIKGAIRKKRTTLRALSARNGFHISSVSQALKTPMPRVEAVIARFLGIKPQAIWPSRYDRAGHPLRDRSTADQHNKGGARAAERQKAKAA